MFGRKEIGSSLLLYWEMPVQLPRNGRALLGGSLMEEGLSVAEGPAALFVCGSRFLPVAPELPQEEKMGGELKGCAVCKQACKKKGGFSLPVFDQRDPQTRAWSS